MKHSVKLLLWKQKNKLGFFPIYLRIIVNSKVRYISTGYAVAKHHWDEKNRRVKDTHGNADLINKDIGDLLSKALADVVEKKIKKQQVNADLLKRQLSSRVSGSNYFDFVDKFSEDGNTAIDNLIKKTLEIISAF